MGARLSYVWRDDFLDRNEVRIFANPIGIWRSSEASLDLQLSYDVNENLAVSFDAVNLTEEMQQEYYAFGSAGGPYDDELRQLADQPLVRAGRALEAASSCSMSEAVRDAVPPPRAKIVSASVPRHAAYTTTGTVMTLSRRSVWPPLSWPLFSRRPRRHTPKQSKPPLHGQHWVAVTGKPLAATAGARIFIQGGNAVDAACAMIAATSTMWDTLGWGGETQALIYNPHTRKVIGVNALGVAPTGATPEFYQLQGLRLSAGVRSARGGHAGHAGRHHGDARGVRQTQPRRGARAAIEMADGYPIEAQTADLIEKWKDELRKWPESRRTFLVHEGKDGTPLPGNSRVGPEAGEIFRQPELAVTLRKLVDTEAKALQGGQESQAGHHGRLRSLL